MEPSITRRTTLAASGRTTPRSARWPVLRAATVIALLLACTGCVRETVGADVAEYHYKWWNWGWPLIALAVAGITAAKYPPTWINGAWRSRWNPRGWDHFDLIRTVGFFLVAIVAPMQLCNRVTIDSAGFEELNALGLRATRRLAWSDMARLDLKGPAPAAWRRDLQKEHDKKPDLVAVLKDGRTESFVGMLVTQAQPELIRRARAAGVPVVETNDPGIAPPGAELPAAAPPARAPDVPPRPDAGLFPAPRRPGRGAPFGREPRGGL